MSKEEYGLLYFLEYYCLLASSSPNGKCGSQICQSQKECVSRVLTLSLTEVLVGPWEPGLMGHGGRHRQRGHQGTTDMYCRIFSVYSRLYCLVRLHFQSTGSKTKLLRISRRWRRVWNKAWDSSKLGDPLVSTDQEIRRLALALTSDDPENLP